jgi:hypothetical protein
VWFQWIVTSLLLSWLYLRTFVKFGVILPLGFGYSLFSKRCGKFANLENLRNNDPAR